MRALLVHVRPHRHTELVEADELYRELAATQLTA